MQPDNEWDDIRGERGFPGLGLLRPVLLFGSAAIALALILVPVLDDATHVDIADSGPLPQGLDMTSTGSVGPSGRTYIVRRSVLQASPDAVCVIRSNNVRLGDC